MNEELFTHWLHEVHSWGEGWRRIRLIEIIEPYVYFQDSSGWRKSRHRHHIKRLEPFDWQPLTSQEVYVEVIAAQLCFSDHSTAAEAQELRMRCQYLVEKLSLVKYDYWALRTEEVIQDCLLWYPGRNNETNS
jgi:hypothetical protein